MSKRHIFQNRFEFSLENPNGAIFSFGVNVTSGAIPYGTAAAELNWNISRYHARRKEHLEDRLELLRCYYNFIRPHRALKFGSEVRTPAMQAGLVSTRLSYRDIFTTMSGRILFVTVFIDATVDLNEAGEQ